MTIRTDLTYEEALALPDPKSIWVDGERIEVRTGDDVEQPAERAE